uniref:Uncharacterized protein n=1 Tax=Rhizophora mucronata TaxID=61149 RepID=A0A2P2N3V6_RHIMU
MFSHQEMKFGKRVVIYQSKSLPMVSFGIFVEASYFQNTESISILANHATNEGSSHLYRTKNICTSLSISVFFFPPLLFSTIFSASKLFCYVLYKNSKTIKESKISISISFLKVGLLSRSTIVSAGSETANKTYCRLS